MPNVASSPQSPATRIAKAIRASPARWIPFDRFMDLALYAEPGGYYAARTPDDAAGADATQPPIVGRGGDFYTSVSVGGCFGFLLARVCHEFWEALGRPEPFDLIECGAHDGRLCRDILDGLEEWRSPLAAIVRPVLVERSGRLRERQAEVLGPWSPRATVAADLSELARSPTPNGIVLANELLDALPVRLVHFSGGRWRERGVTLATADGAPPAAFAWSDRAIDDQRLASVVEGFGRGFPDGYLTEVHLAAGEWIAAAARIVGRGLFLLFDYGFAARDYRDPQRTAGTLRTFLAHRAGTGENDPLEAPGTRDITADVDFTAVTAAAETAGLRLAGFCDQHHFLVRTAGPWLEALERDPTALAAGRQRLRQFQTLTHPGLMGRAFKVLGLAKDIDAHAVPRGLSPYSRRSLLFDDPA